MCNSNEHSGAATQGAQPLLITDSVAFRDLSWLLLGSKPIMESTVYHNHGLRGDLNPGDREQLVRELARWGRHGKWLDRILKNDKPLLGRYAERLICWGLRMSPRHVLVERGIQVHHKGRTLGELDFLVHDRLEDEYEHWEIAVKFFLGHGDRSRMENWKGPNPRDRLDKKFDKLLHHQLPLSRKPSAQKVLRKLGADPDRLRRRLLFKGYLFHPAGSSRDRWPERINRQAATGWWCYTHELREVLGARHGLKWCRLDRLDWLRPARASEADHLLEDGAMVEEAVSTVQSNRYAALIAGLRATESGEWAEAERGFVVPRSWPG